MASASRAEAKPLFGLVKGRGQRILGSTAQSIERECQATGTGRA